MTSMHRLFVSFLLLIATVLALGPPVCALDKPSTRLEPNVRLVVVAPDEFLPALRDYLAKRPASVFGELHSLKDVLAASKGKDDAEKVKRWLYDRWNSDKFNHVLLVGDADLFPVRYMVLDRVTEPAFDYAFYPSDLYYADLCKQDGSFESWNAITEDFHGTYFGEVRGEKNKSDPINFDQVDYLAEVGVGRWPISTLSELETVIGKSLAYERAILQRAENEVGRAAFVYVDGWIDSRPQMRLWGEQLPKAWSREWLFASPEAPAQSRHRANDVVQCLNEGCDLLLHTGHGFPEGWDQSFGSVDLGRLDNFNRLPVIISAGCSTAYFATLPPYESYLDASGVEHKGTNAGEVFNSPPPPPANYQTGQYNRTGLGEQLLKSGRGGAVAYFGCNTGSQPCGLTLVDGFTRGLQLEPTPRLGSCWQNAIRHYYEQEKLAEIQPTADWYPASIFFQGMKFMLFGDPSLPLPRTN